MATSGSEQTVGDGLPVGAGQASAGRASAGRAPGEPVRRFRSAVRPPVPRAAAAVGSAALALYAALGVVHAVGAGRPLAGLWPGLLLLGLGVGLAVSARAELGVDVSRSGLRPARSRRPVPWSDVASVEERGRWRDQAVVTLRTGRELLLLGVPDEDVRRVAAVVEGEDPRALEDLLTGPDVLAPGSGRGSPRGRSEPRRRRAAWLGAGGCVGLAVAQTGPFVGGDVGRGIFSGSVLVAVVLSCWAGLTHFRTTQEPAR